MSNLALYLGMAALLCAAGSLLGGALARLWGVDPSRETPGTYSAGKGRLLRWRLLGFLAALPAMLWMGAAAEQAFGPMGALLFVIGAALLCMVLGFGALFASLRHGGRGMAHICGEELFPAAGKIRHALGAVACVLSSGAMLMALLQNGRSDVTNGMLFVFSCALLPMLSMQIAAHRLAPAIRNERQMLPAAMGGVVSAALLAMLTILSGGWMPPFLPVIAAMMAGIALVWLIAWAVLADLGGRELQGLFERPLARKRRGAGLYVFFCLLASALLALLGGPWLFLGAGALCVLTALTDAIVCALWRGRIGRGLFF